MSVAPSTEMAELEALAAVQQQQLDTTLFHLTNLTSGGRFRGVHSSGGKKKKGRGRHMCKNCKRLAYHNDDKCMELEKNANLQYVGWNIFLE